ncbi:MAG: hypothetical protein ACT4OO_06940 [Nitrospiraceae bacterium]
MEQAQGPELTPKQASCRFTGPGIAVFSCSGRMLHFNERAVLLSHLLNDGGMTYEDSSTRSPLPPKEVVDLCRDILHRLQQRMKAEDWTEFEVKRVVGATNRPIVLRGFGVPDRKAQERCRVVITLQA